MDGDGSAWREMEKRIAGTIQGRGKRLILWRGPTTTNRAQKMKAKKAPPPPAKHPRSTQISDSWKLEWGAPRGGGEKRGTVGGLLRRNPSLYNFSGDAQPDKDH